MFIRALLIVLVAVSARCAEGLALPEVLKTADSKVIKSPEQWRQDRRPQILELFKEHVYGRAPVGRPDDLRFEVTETRSDFMGGRATRKLVDISFSGPGGEGRIGLIRFIPNKAPKPVPAFLLICHRGRDNIDPSRQVKEPFWPAEEIVSRGYAALTFHVSDVDPDNYDEFKDGVHGIFDPPGAERSGDAWGSIAAWAWGASRVMDYIETDADIDDERVAVIGHSRGGKTALWCGARDERFAFVISNDSGCTGAALARRKQGERVADINKNFPHWFCENYNEFNGKEENLPVDQHMLIALMAPRLVYVASATEDTWADPKGEFLACVEASPVYELYGMKGLGVKTMPEPDTPVQIGHIGYHIRSGSHNLTLFDWRCYMDFADKHWGKSNE
ncbi:MAG: prolyl oligopeptidase family serine peptidase [Verrucomicrobia bacterium]|nr:prolyl oligopeptidase family serine peptidase [Verrucomicrobiota bacterium]MCF7707537.1 prolyl oligopeptidase family serine peptidase [Verrucomicrobiota bacterium]